MPDEVQLDDLISAGTFGLIEAVERFEPERGVAFNTYASNRIRGAMLDWLRKQDWVPRNVRCRSKRLGDAAASFRAETGRNPDREELREYVGVNPYEFRKLEGDSVPVQVASLNEVVNTGVNGSRDQYRIDSVVDPKAVDPSADPYHTSLRDLLLKHFRLTDALLIKLHFVDGLPVPSIAPMLIGVCEGHLYHRRRRILARLRLEYGEQLYDLLGDGNGRAA